MLRVWGCMVQYRPATANTGKFERRARWGVHLGIGFEHHAWNILDHDTSRVVAARDVTFYEDLTILKFQCDHHADRTRGQNNVADYDGPPRSFATPADEAEAAIADQGPTDPHPSPRPWSDEDEDEDSAPLDSSRDSLLSPTPSNGNHSDADIVEVSSGQQHSPAIFGLQLLGLHTAVSRPPKAVEPKTPRHALTGPYNKEWRTATNAEVAVLKTRDTWVLADRVVLKGRPVKTAADGTIKRFKACWVVGGFTQLPHDPGINRPHFRGDYIILTAYVDDLLYTGTSNELHAQFALSNHVEITSTDNATQFLGVNISYATDSIHPSATKYAETLYAKFHIKPANLSTPYRTPATPHNTNTTLLDPSGHQLYQQQLGCLLFAAVTCNPDLSYISSQLAQYTKQPEGENMMDLQCAVQYLSPRCTSDSPIQLSQPLAFSLVGYVDADHAANLANRWS
ncbi:unnamed protein product [Closterium sp. NIES-54]